MTTRSEIDSARIKYEGFGCFLQPFAIMTIWTQLKLLFGTHKNFN